MESHTPVDVKTSGKAGDTHTVPGSKRKGSVSEPGANAATEAKPGGHGQPAARGVNCAFTVTANTPEGKVRLTSVLDMSPTARKRDLPKDIITILVNHPGGTNHVLDRLG